MSLFVGQALLTPGFCFNRITDFMCYMWIMPSLKKNNNNDLLLFGDKTMDNSNVDMWSEITDLSNAGYDESHFAGLYSKKVLLLMY